MKETTSTTRIHLLPIAQIRKDGETQCRLRVNSGTIRDYQALYRAGADFPPIRVWFDGNDYWLADGFQRIAAAQNAGRREIMAEVHQGSLSDAQWDSYACNSTHGLPRSKSDMRLSLDRALKHPNAESISHHELARHLGIPEATLRRWRKKSSTSNGEDSIAIRTVIRKGKVYSMRTSAIGKNSVVDPSTRSRLKSISKIEKDLEFMKNSASPDVRRVINVVANWAVGPVTAADCLRALEGAFCFRPTKRAAHS